MNAIRVLDMQPVGWSDRTPRYGFSHGLPWVRTTDQVRPTEEAAFEDAVAWARGYEAADRFGNMASALGVAEKGDGYVGVVNYYHSNT